jgi:DNA-binding MarR family transcriptional regulator
LQNDDAQASEIEAALSGDAGPRGGRYLATGGQRQRPRIRYSHQAMCDLILQEPGITQNALAAAFGYTPAWVSTIVNSDAFQALLAQRRADLVDPEITLSLNERAKALAVRSMQVLQEKISRPADQVPDGLALRAFELAAKATALGGNAPAPAASDPMEYLPALAERLKRLQGHPYTGEVVDVHPIIREE